MFLVEYTLFMFKRLQPLFCVIHHILFLLPNITIVQVLYNRSSIINGIVFFLFAFVPAVFSCIAFFLSWQAARRLRVVEGADDWIWAEDMFSPFARRLVKAEKLSLCDTAIYERYSD